MWSCQWSRRGEWPSTTSVRDRLRRERLPEPGVMWWPRSRASSPAESARWSWLPISTNERGTACCLRPAQALLGRSPSGVVVAQGEDRAEDGCGSPAASSAVVVRPLWSSAAHRRCPSWAAIGVALVRLGGCPAGLAHPPQSPPLVAWPIGLGLAAVLWTEVAAPVLVLGRRRAPAPPRHSPEEGAPLRPKSCRLVPTSEAFLPTPDLAPDAMRSRHLRAGRCRRSPDGVAHGLPGSVTSPLTSPNGR
jgi:hypothetical protein